MPRLAAPPPLVSAPQLRLAWETGIGDHVIRIVWSPDGGLLAIAAVSGAVQVRNGATGDLLCVFDGHGFGTQSLAWNKSGKLLASGGQDGMARSWSLAEGRCVAEFEGGAPWVEHVAWHPLREDALLTAAGRKLRYRSANGALIREYPDFDSTIYDLAWQPGSTHFAVAGYGGIVMYKDDAKEQARRFDWKGSILSFAYSPNGNFIATGNQDASVHFWYRKSGKDLQMTGYMTKVRELSWDAGSRFLATGGSPVVTVWDCSGKGPAGSTPAQLDEHGVPVSALAFQHAGALLASGCPGGLVCVWNHRKPDRPLRQARLDGGITQLAWAADDKKFAAASASGAVRVFIASEQA